MEQFITQKLEHGRLDGNGGLSAKSISDITVIIKEVFKFAQYYSAEDL